MYGEYISKAEAQSALDGILADGYVTNTSETMDITYPLSSVVRFAIKTV